jgi:RNA 3'-terminal phosphate cyclase (ATP)
VSVLTIDGSTGEGGGQILRTALSLSILLAVPVRVVNIRAGRRQPGLRPQHVQAVKAAAAICAAQVEGARERSPELTFAPQAPPQAGSYHFDIGTAGAATLVLQTLLVPLSQAGGPSQVTVRGGTHVAWSPPYHYLEAVYLPALASLGYNAGVELVRWGFYPRGGGEIRAAIRPAAHRWPPARAGAGTAQADGPEDDLAQREPLPWTQPRGALHEVAVLSAAAHVGNQVTARQASQAYNRLAAAGIHAQTRLLNPPSAGPGTCLFLLATFDGGTRAGFTGYGRRGYPAERVADDAVDAFLAHHATDRTVDPYLADQLILPLSLAESPMTFETSRITRHLLTNAWVVEQFLGRCFEIQGQEGQPGRIVRQ